VDTGDGQLGSVFDCFEDLSVPEMLKKAQKLGGDPFEDTGFATNQAFIFIKPHAVTDGVKQLVRALLGERSIGIIAEGAISADAIAEGSLVDNHYYSIASKVRGPIPSQMQRSVPCALRLGGWDVAAAAGPQCSALWLCLLCAINRPERTCARPQAVQKISGQQTMQPNTHTHRQTPSAHPRRL